MECHRIYRPAKTATQSGDWHGHHWRMDWDILSKGHRWENPLMGWQSSADCMQGTHINFKSKEDAIHFAEKQGYEYFVQEPNLRRILPKAYANNFLHSPTKLKHIRTKWGIVKILYIHKRRKRTDFQCLHASPQDLYPFYSTWNPLVQAMNRFHYFTTSISFALVSIFRIMRTSLCRLIYF